MPHCPVIIVALGAALGTMFIAPGLGVDDPDQPALTIDALMARFGKMPGLEARFHEEKTISLLALPLVSEGTLHFAPPARLVRHTLGPDGMTLLIDGDTLSFGDESDQEQIDLDANPAVRDYVESFLRLLKGDREELDRLWRMELTGRTDAWRLTLHPIIESIRRTLRSMTFEGRGSRIERMVIVETTGDESVTTFSEINPERSYNPAELERIFRILPRRE